jgi:hypothetical protein
MDTVSAFITKGKALNVFRLRRSHFRRQRCGIIVQVFTKAAFIYHIREALSAKDHIAFIRHFSSSGFFMALSSSYALTIKRRAALVNDGL